MRNLAKSAMGVMQSNLGNRNSSNNSGGNQSPTILILFGAPFLLFGIIALVAAIHGAKKKDLPILLSVGGILFCVGLGIMAAGFRLRKKAKQAAGLQTQHPDQPWLWHADWAEGKIKSSAMAQPQILLTIGLGFCSIGGVGAALSLPEELHKGNYAALAVLFFPLIGIILLIAFVNAWRSQRRFGKCFFELAQIPAPLGGVLEGMIQTGAPLKLEHELHLKISCTRRVQAGKNTKEYTLWQSETIYTTQASLPVPEAGHTGIPVHFKLPNDQPECYSRGNESVFWRLEAKTKMRGPDFHAIFDIPVFKIADAVAADADESDPTAALQAPIEEIRRDENSKIRISGGPNGREFYFPAARNLGTALFTTLLMLIFNGIAIVTFRLHAPILFPMAFGLFGVLLLWGAFSLWFKSSCVTIDSTNVRVTNRWLIFSRTRQFSTSDVERFATKTGMQSGSQIFTDIKLIKRGDNNRFEPPEEKSQGPQQLDRKLTARFRAAAEPSGVTVGSNIANVVEANWLVTEMNKALARKS